MRVVKRTGEFQTFDRSRIEKAILAAFNAVSPNSIPNIGPIVDRVVDAAHDDITVEAIQDLVETSLMHFQHHEVAKAYILYRDDRTREREARLSPDPSAIRDYILRAKYARNGAETFKETALRCRNMHIAKYPALREQITEVWDEYVLTQRVLPSMRSLQFGGDAISIHNERMYNCSFTLIDRPEVFGQILFLLLCGCGVGFSVQWGHIEQLPSVRRLSRKVRHFHIPDTIEGWGMALDQLMHSYLIYGDRVEFNYSLIRPEGAELRITGGTAPGHLPLKESLEKIRFILDVAQGRRLRPIEIHDIICIAAECVLSGGIRRSSLISLFSPDDGEMMIAKTGNWMETHPWRKNANNSAVFMRDYEDRGMFRRVMQSAKEFGDPGFFFTWNRDWGCNPCGEIGLDPTSEIGTGFAFCNLTEINGAKCQTSSDLQESAEAAAFIGTLQAGYTNFPLLGEATELIAKRDALLGVSITGIMDRPDVCLDPESQRLAAQHAVDVNETTALLIGIRSAKRVTTIKPSGTASLALGAVANGIHPHHSRRYLRRVIGQECEGVFRAFRDANPHMCTRKPDGDWVITFPIEVPEEAITKKNCDTKWFLEQVISSYKNWILPGSPKQELTHNVSCTVLIRDDEWSWVEQFLWEHRCEVQSISVFPDCGEIVHPFAPMQDADDSWNHLIEHYRPVGYTGVTGNTLASACEGERCSI